MKGFSAFLDMSRCKNWAHKIGSWKYLTLWRSVVSVFPEHRVPHFCSPPWASSEGVGGQRLQAARDLILVEVDGKHPWHMPVHGWHQYAETVSVNGIGGQGVSVVVVLRDTSSVWSFIKVAARALTSCIWDACFPVAPADCFQSCGFWSIWEMRNGTSIELISVHFS